MSRVRCSTLVLSGLLFSLPVMAQTSLTKKASAQAVLDWNAIALTTVGGQNGVEQVRLLAIAHLAMFEAVNAIARDFAPYLGSIVAPPGASAEAAAVTAAHDVLEHYVPDQAGPLDAALEKSLSGIPDGPGKKSGMIVGEAAAAAMILHRQNDGSLPLEFYTPTSTEPGQWQLTPSCSPSGGAFLHWRNLKPFGIRRGNQFRSDPPPRLAGRHFARDYSEVKAVGGINSEKRPPDRADVARFFAVVVSQGVWNPVARQIVQAERTSLSDAARSFALLNMALNDALVSVMDTKYHYTFWRPETAIRAGDTDGNDDTEPDVTFAPFIATPCHPSYPSAHASSSYAAREVLERLFGDGRHAIELSTPSLPGVVLRYTRLKRITHDINDARIFGGIHYRFDQQAGALQGIRVGGYVLSHNLRRRSHDRAEGR